MTSFLEAEIQHEDSNMNVIMDYLSGYLERIRGLKVAIVMDTPMVTSTIIMGQRVKSMQIKPFSTVEAAIEWIEN